MIHKNRNVTQAEKSKKLNSVGTELMRRMILEERNETLSNQCNSVSCHQQKLEYVSPVSIVHINIQIFPFLKVFSPF